MKVAIIGATGLVGSELLKVFVKRDFPVTELILSASEKSVGKEIEFKGVKHKVVSVAEVLNQKPQIVFLAANTAVSREFAPLFESAGAVVIDNSSAWRDDAGKKLIVPELNADLLTKSDRIIANPSCATIQMVMALAPLHERYKIKRIVMSTYQSVTGTGIKALNQLMNERKGLDAEMVYEYRIDMNLIPQIDVFLENGYSEEEMKIVSETRKVFNDPSIQMTVTTVRVPVIGGHSESINVEFEKDFDLDEVHQYLAAAQGILLRDDPLNALYPMPIDSHQRDLVMIGRIRRDQSQPKTMNLWVVADNLRKGAATNSVQIAEHLIIEELI